jgi:hypothetical protein
VFSLRFKEIDELQIHLIKGSAGNEPSMPVCHNGTAFCS